MKSAVFMLVLFAAPARHPNAKSRCLHGGTADVQSLCRCALDWMGCQIFRTPALKRRSNPGSPARKFQHSN